MRKLMLACVPCPVLTTFAKAQSVENVVQDFRLIGAWASDCYKPPDPRNEHATFSKTPSSNIQLVNDFGSNYDHMVYRIFQAERVGQDRLYLRQVLTTDHLIVVDVVIWKVNDRIRIWSSRLTDGTTLVNNGTVASENGQETMWVVRCERSAAQPLGADVIP